MEFTRFTRRMRRGAAVFAGVAVVALALASCTRPAATADTEDPAEFFEGQTIRWIVPFAAGGGTDTSARVLAPLLSEYIPGNPKVQVENIEGGNGVLGVNEFAQTDPDGLTILLSSASISNAVLFGDPAVEFDFQDFTAIVGMPAGNTQYVSSLTRVEEPLDVFRSEVPLVYGGITPGGGEFSRVLSMDLLGLDVEEVWGYESRSAAQIAFSQGEVNIDGQSTAAYIESIEPLVERGEAVPVYTTGMVEDGELVRDPAFPDLPHAVELYEEHNNELPDTEMLDAFAFLVLVTHNLQKQLWVHDGTPDVALEGYATAFEAMQADADWENVRQALGGYDFLLGEQLEQDITTALYEPPQELIDWLAAFAAENYGADLSRG